MKNSAQRRSARPELSFRQCAARLEATAEAEYRLPPGVTKPRSASPADTFSVIPDAARDRAGKAPLPQTNPADLAKVIADSETGVVPCRSRVSVGALVTVLLGTEWPTVVNAE
jgi:hypothetical protein